jgi:hypothetical protein
MLLSLADISFSLVENFLAGNLKYGFVVSALQIMVSAPTFPPYIPVRMRKVLMR